MSQPCGLVERVLIDVRTPVDATRVYNALHDLDPAVTREKVECLLGGVGLATIVFQPEDYTLITDEDVSIGEEEDEP